MKLKSTYRKNDEDFVLDVIGETETTYICRHVPEDINKFQNADKEFELRKILIGQIYEVLEEKKENQISIFELLEG